MSDDALPPSPTTPPSRRPGTPIQELMSIVNRGAALRPLAENIILPRTPEATTLHGIPPRSHGLLAVTETTGSTGSQTSPATFAPTRRPSSCVPRPSTPPYLRADATPRGLDSGGTPDRGHPSSTSFSASPCSELDSDGILDSTEGPLPPTASVAASPSTANVDWESRPLRQTRACAKLLVRSGLRCGGCFDYRWHCQCKAVLPQRGWLMTQTSRVSGCSITQTALLFSLHPAHRSRQVPANAEGTDSANRPPELRGSRYWVLYLFVFCPASGSGKVSGSS